MFWRSANEDQIGRFMAVNRIGSDVRSVATTQVIGNAKFLPD